VGSTLLDDNEDIKKAAACGWKRSRVCWLTGFCSKNRLRGGAPKEVAALPLLRFGAQHAEGGWCLAEWRTCHLSRYPDGVASE